MRFRPRKVLLRYSALLAGALLLASFSGPTRAEESNDACFDPKGSIKEALDACAAFLASNPTDQDRIVKAHTIRAIGLSATDNVDGAIAELDEAIRLDPTRANSFFMRGAAYEAKGEHDKALTDLDEAIRLDPTPGDFYLMRGIVYNQKGDLDRAIAELDQKVKLDPESTQGYSKRAELYRQKKDYDHAVADYAEVIKLDHGAAKGYVDQGWIYVLRNDLDKAMEDFTNALKIEQSNASALFGRGLVKSRQGKPTDGSNDLALAKQLEPEIVDMIKKLGVE
jgi:tetratricopeptide (TPR) repeat protein